MLNDIKIILGLTNTDTSKDALLSLLIKQTELEVSAYCKRDINFALEGAVERIVVLKYNRIGTEGLSSESFSGISNNFLDGLPKDLLDFLNSQRRIQVL